VLAPGGSGIDHLLYYGDGGSYQQINGRTLQFVVLNADDSVARLEQTTAAIDPLCTPGDLSVGFRKVFLNPALQQFAWTDFPLSAPGVTVFGNVVAVTQGKTQPQAVLGNGDARQIFQTWMIPKGPLTWIGDEALTPPRTPQLQVLVNNIEWNEVDSLFAAGLNDTSYIIRLDTSGNSWIQFGDGINGARLPSGVGNILITNRSGVGANGDRTPGTNPVAASQAQNLTAIRLYETVTGGAAPESSDNARQTAPGRVQSLGRLVSLSDFEYEALALPGVEKAQANWELGSNGVPLLLLTVLLADPSDAATASVQASMSLANTARGPQRFQVQVQAASLLYVYLNLTFGLTAGYQATNVAAAIGTALGVIPPGGTAPSGGLFSQDQRELGGPEYASRIQGVVQNVAGVAWVEVTAFDQLGSADDPSTLSVPATLALVDQVPCAPNQVLALYGGQFNPTSSTAAAGTAV
jgi:predicted phage baseplate assembly protein